MRDSEIWKAIFKTNDGHVPQIDPAVPKYVPCECERIMLRDGEPYETERDMHSLDACTTRFDLRRTA